jgi:hypothetical protein
LHYSRDRLVFINAVFRKSALFSALNMYFSYKIFILNEKSGNQNSSLFYVRWNKKICAMSFCWPVMNVKEGTIQLQRIKKIRLVRSA